MTALPVPAGRVTRAALDTVRDQIAPGASDLELDYFARVCNQLELSPFADQIVLVGRFNKRLNREVFRHQITVAGRRALATRTGRLAGIEGPVWCGPRNDAGELDWRDVWDDNDAPPYCARVLVYVAGWQIPANGTAKWSEFAQYDSSGKFLIPTWAAMPSHMLGKVAESMALRRAFPDAITADVVDGFAGVYDPDAPELDDAAAERAVLDAAGRAATVPPPDPPVELEDDPAPPSSSRTLAPGDQSNAHRAVAMLSDQDRAAFLERYRIDDYGDVWPVDAVLEALAEVERG